MLFYEVAVVGYSWIFVCVKCKHACSCLVDICRFDTLFLCYVAVPENRVAATFRVGFSATAALDIFVAVC